MCRLIDRLRGLPVKYLIMDAGWYKDAADNWDDMTGDWIPSREKYPDGLEKTTDAIREAGFIPGIWFEFETCGPLSRAYAQDAHHLKKFGMPLICNKRGFWDFRDPWVWDYLCDRVIGFLKKYQKGRQQKETGLFALKYIPGKNVPFRRHIRFEL